MPDNKNQHYVPRCHLKPFSLNREGRAINLLNHPKEIIRENVPVSGQCAKSYFYGEDLVIEKQLQSLEGRYAAIVRRVEEGAHLDDGELRFLKEFAFLQWCRTDGALRRRREAMEAMDQLTRRGIEDMRVDRPDLSQKSMVLGSLKVWATCGEDIADLRVLILSNRSRVDFVTSDDPAVVTNRVSFQRMRDDNFGVATVGAMLIMPLGPRYAVICYDHDAYSPVGRMGHVVNIDRDQDARAFNELQYLNSLVNIYFAGPVERGQQIAADFRAVAARRPTVRLRMWQGVSEGIEGNFECFRRVRDDEQINPLATRIQSFSPLYPQPMHWMSNFPMRANILGWVKPGTPAGPYRRARGEAKGLRPVPIRGPQQHRAGRLPDRMYHELSNAELAKARAREARQAKAAVP